jgi:hypothetical protein
MKKGVFLSTLIGLGFPDKRGADIGINSLNQNQKALTIKGRNINAF